MVKFSHQEKLAYRKNVETLERESNRNQKKLENVYLIDAIYKIFLRFILVGFFLCFLWWQNKFVYEMVNRAIFTSYDQDGMQDLGNLLPILVTGTIAQTVSIVAIMVRWVFTDIDYKNNPMNGN